MSSEAWRQEKAFLDSMLLQRSGNSRQRTPPVPSPAPLNDETTPVEMASASSSVASVAEKPVGLDHLDNLCKLMEQLGELRDQNSRLQKRVQYLEDMKTIQQMHHELHIFSVSTESMAKDETKEDNHSIESLDIDLVPKNSDSSAAKTEKPTHPLHLHHQHEQHKNKTPQRRFKKPLLLKYRERSRSVGFDEPAGTSTSDDGPGAPPESNVNVDEDRHLQQQQQRQQQQQHRIVLLRPKTKVSKWTRVKEAFRWEKAHVDPSTTHGRHSVPQSPSTPQLSVQVLVPGKICSVNSYKKIRNKSNVYVEK